MRTVHMKLVIMALAIAGLAGVFLLQQQQVERLRAENAALRQQAAEAAARRAETERRAGQPPSAPEASRLQPQQAELLRLRGEVTRVRNEARQNAARGATSGPLPAASAAASGEPESDPVSFTSVATVSVGSGETFATGGWLTAPGSRTFLLATPTLGQGDTDGKTINVAMCLVKVVEGDLPEGLLRKLQGQAEAGSSVLTGTEAAFLLNQANSGAASNVVSRPHIATSDGVPASLFVGESRPNPDGTHREIGTRIDLSPQITEDGKTIWMGVNLEYVPREAQDEGDTPAKAN